MKSYPSLFLLLLLKSSCSGDFRSTPPNPEEMLRTFQISSEFRVEIFAAEPYVTDPVELTFDERGRAWVAEMRDYPYDPVRDEQSKSRIRVLEDRDGDGRVDHSTIFADGLPNLKSVLPWKDGVLASSAPNILYLKDTDGDLKADEKIVLFTGFSVLVDPEGQVSNLRFGIDNWIYTANDSQAGQITSSRSPHLESVSVLNSDFRFRLDRNIFEAASGATRFGHSFDEWGQRFFSQAGRPINHVVMARRYLKRNPFLTAPLATQFISDHSQRIFQLTPPEAWREARTRMRRRRSREMGKFRDRVSTGYFSGATGNTIYTGDTFPKRYHGNAFSGDVAGNIIHRDILSPSGPSFIASRAEEEQQREFMASTSRWFRPANFSVGPDGNLYVVDICRKFVETPASIPEPIKEGLNFYSGTGHGRIYRIVPKNLQSGSFSWPQLHQATTAQLVDQLANQNQWWRLTAQRLLLHRQDSSAIVSLRKMLLTHKAPQARIHSLYALEALSGLEESVLIKVLKDPHPAVREHAVTLAEYFPGLLADLLDMTGDSSPRVAFQLALSLGEFPAQEVLGGFRNLLDRYAQDQWYRAAILSSESGSSLELLKSMLSDATYFEDENSGKVRFLEELAAVVGARNQGKEIQQLIRLLAQSPTFKKDLWKISGLSGLARGLKLGQVLSLELESAKSSLKTLLASPSSKIQEMAAKVARHFRIPSLVVAAKREALQKTLPTNRRSSSIQILASADFKKVRPIFEELLSEMNPDLIQATLETLSFFEDPGVGQLVLDHWSKLAPQERPAALKIFLNNPTRVQDLLQAIEKGIIERGALNHQQRQFLRQYPDDQIKKHVLKLLNFELKDRNTLVQEYLSVLELDPDPQNGRSVFRRECARCHEPDQGIGVGPGLQTAVQGHTREQILFDILNPNGLILSSYQNYIVTTDNGRVYGGIIVKESPGTLTLRNGPNQEETILRGRIAEIRNSEVSIMPEGFEESLSRQELADVISFMQGGYLIPKELETHRDN